MASEVRQLDLILNLQDKASKELRGLSGSIEKMQPAFQKMAVVGTAAIAGITVGISKTISLARDFEEETNKFGVVFKDVSQDAEDMAKTLNKSYGLSILESKQLLSSTGDILTGFGFTGEAALDLSSNVNTLAVDLASFTNAQGGAEAVSSALTKALLGERESLKTYGIAIQEADVQAKLLDKGMGDLTGEALRQAKAQVTLEIAMEQSKNAIGDYARSAGSLTQTQIELKKNIEDTAIILGQTFAPILNDVLKRITPVIVQVRDWIEQNPELTKKIVIAAAAVAVLVTAIGGLGLALPAIIAGISALISPFGAILGVFALLLPKIIQNKDAIIAFVQNGINKMKEAWEKFKPTLDIIIDTLLFLWDVAKTFLTPIFKVLQEELGKLWASVKELWEIVSPVLIPALKLLGSILGIAIIVAIIGVIAVLGTLASWLVSITTALVDFGKNAIQAWKDVWDAAKKYVGFIVKAWTEPLDLFIEILNKIGEIRAKIGGKIGKFFGGGGDGNVTNVNDAIITPRGDVIKTDPADFLIATKTPGDLANGGGGQVNHITFPNAILLDRNSGNIIAEMLDQKLRLKQRVL